MIDLKNCKVRWERENYVPKKVYGFESAVYKGTPKEAAEKFLRENLETLKITASLKDLKFDKTSESLGAKTVLFQQYYEGTPVHGAWVAVHIDNQNKVFMVKNDTVPVEKIARKVTKTKTALMPGKKIDNIIKTKIKEYGILDSPVKKENMIYAIKGNLRRAWKVRFGTKKPAASWILFIDAATGHIIEERNVLRKASGAGQVFMPNPIVTLNRDDLYDLKDSDQGVFKTAYKKVALNDLAQRGYLKGPYADTTNTPKPARSSNYEFIYTRYDDRFEEVMAYYHIDSVQRYIQSLGFTGNKGILNRPIKVNAHGGKDDNSYYDPSPNKRDLTFGDGGVDDAEEADVILHEYGHAIQDAIIPGFGQTNEGRSMGEGFGDYLAASFFSKYKKGTRKIKFAEWDAKGYTGGPYECLRRLDSNKHYPEDMEGEEHADGEIWSACLWKVRKLLGRKKADTVILESHFYLSQYCDFKDGAEAIIMAEKNLFGGKRTKGLTKIFKDRGIL
ncbi:MAG: M36 family metallopeptidase [Nitrospirota bacterium]